MRTRNNTATARIVAQFEAENPPVHEAFKRFTFEAAQKRDHYGARDTIGRIQWETSVVMDDRSGLKVNDHFAPLHARKFAEEHPELEDFSRMRASRFDAPANGNDAGQEGE